MSQRWRTALLVLGFLSLFSAIALAVITYASAETNGSAAAGVKSWSEQIRRSPHYGFVGTEYNKAQWPIVMKRMATIGQLPYSEAVRIGNYLSLLAPEPKQYPEPLNWLNRHFVLTGFGNVGSNLLGEKETGISYSQNIYGLFGDRWLLQMEPEFNVGLHPKREFEFELEQFHLTYFLGDRLHVTGGKIPTDFNFSAARLHPSWINLSPNLPWAANFAPASTWGGKIGWNAPILSGRAMLNGSFFGGVGTEIPQIEATRVFGTRVEIFMPEYELEFGFSYAYAKTESGHMLGGYFIKQFDRIKLQGEFVKSITAERGFSYWLEASSSLHSLPIKNAAAQYILSRTTPVLRWQQFVAGTSHHEEEADHTEETDMAAETDEHAAGEAEVGHAEGKDDHHGTVPEGNAAELYAGLNYDLIRTGSYLVRLQGGYAFGFGETDSKAKVGVVFRW